MTNRILGSSGGGTGQALRVTGLDIAYVVNRVATTAVQGLSFSIVAGETLCLVGESGSGKTSVAMAIPALLPDNARVKGRIEVEGASVYELDAAALRNLRQKRISVVFQDPVGSLIPDVPVGKQLMRVVALRSGETSQSAVQRHVDALLEQVELRSSDTLLRVLPRELSGGMCQRIMIALALCVEPALLIADEPTSALDALTQDRILDLMTQLQQQHGFGVLLVTHDLRIARRMATHVGVMSAGDLVELQPAQRFFAEPEHPYSRRLLEAAAKLSLDKAMTARVSNA